MKSINIEHITLKENSSASLATFQKISCSFEKFSQK